MRSRRIVVGLVAVVAIAVVGLFVYRRTSQKRADAQSSSAAQAAARAVQVLVANVQRRDVPIYLDGLGNVTALKTVTVRCQVDGRLDQVLFKEGQPVKAGELLARIDPRPFQNQLQQARGALERDRAQLEGAKRNLERYKQLAAKKLIPQQQADDQAATVGQFEGAVRVDQAAIDAARLNLDYANIKSPIDGVTGVRLVDPGNLVRASDANGLVVINQLDPIAVLFSLPQDDLPRVMQELQRSTLTVEAWNRDGTQKLATGPWWTTRSTRRPPPSGSSRCSPIPTACSGPTCSSRRACCSPSTRMRWWCPRRPRSAGPKAPLRTWSSPTRRCSRGPSSWSTPRATSWWWPKG